MPEGDVACAAGYVEDMLSWGMRWIGGEAWVEGGYVVISAVGRMLVMVVWNGKGYTVAQSDLLGGRSTNFQTRCQPKDIRSFMRS